LWGTLVTQQSERGDKCIPLDNIFSREGGRSRDVKITTDKVQTFSCSPQRFEKIRTIGFRTKIKRKEICNDSF